MTLVVGSGAQVSGPATLEVAGLTVAYDNRSGPANVVVRDVSFRLEPGQILGVAGESGCGKSTAALAAIGFRSPGARRLDGQSIFGEIDLHTLDHRALRELWGSRIAYVAQDAGGALNPLHRAGRQVAEPLELHTSLGPAQRTARVLELLEEVGISDPEGAARKYPHQFSGGQQQRVALAIAMACEPDVLILDEPTTGLDVTTQKQITGLIERLVRRRSTAALHISHDLSLLASTCDQIMIMYAGEVVERASAVELYREPRHPYSAALVDAVPGVDETAAIVGLPGLPPPGVVSDRCSFAERCRFANERCLTEVPSLTSIPHREQGTAVGARQVRCLRAAELGPIGSARASTTASGMGRKTATSTALLEVRELRCSYPGVGRGEATEAVAGVSLALRGGQTLAVVGESGSGKSTLLRAVAGLHPPHSGQILFESKLLDGRAVRRSRELRRAIQIVFQDPNASLNPRHTVAASIARPLRLFRPDLRRSEQRKAVLALLDDVRLDSGVADRFPHELSGGQKQRVALARAFAAEPALILCDEVVSALDVSVQASILELLAKLADERDTALLFVTHDLAVVRQIAEEVCVMWRGEICEAGRTEDLFADPKHPYTLSLLAAVPRPRAAVGA